MTDIHGIEDLSLTTLSIAIVVVMMLVREFGYRVGVLRARRAEAADEGVAVLVGGLLALMSFVLAFNLSTSTTRLEDRRSATLEEANAIGTAWLQARAVSDPQGPAIAGILERYLAARQMFAASPEGSAANAEASKAAGEFQAASWREMTALLGKRADPQTVSLANALTHTFDMTTAQNLALGTGLPQRLIWLLLIASALAIWALGFYLGLIGRPRHMLSLILVMLWSGVMTLILDLGTPRLGTINTDLRPYAWVAESFRALDTAP